MYSADSPTTSTPLRRSDRVIGRVLRAFLSSTAPSSEARSVTAPSRVFIAALSANEPAFPVGFDGLR